MALTAKTLRPSPRVMVMLAVVFAAFASLWPVSWAQAVWSRPRAVLSTLLPMLTHPLKAVSDALRRPTDLDLPLSESAVLQRNYLQLLQYTQELERRLSEARDTITQLSRVPPLANLRGTQRLRAGVISASSAAVDATLTLNRGSRQNVAAGMAVIEGYHLIGRVVSVQPMTCTVRLITAPSVGVAVKLLSASPTPGQTGLPVYLKASATPGSFETIIGRDDPVQLNDLALLADDTWPDDAWGYVVGKVTRIEQLPEDPVLRRKVTVEPLMALQFLHRAFVLMPDER